MKLVKKMLTGTVLVSMVFATACSDEDEETGTAGFETSSVSASEDAGVQEIKILLPEALSASTSLYFDLETEAALNGDYKIVTPSPLTIDEGAEYATIKIEIIDEKIIEETETITLTLKAIGNNVAISDDETKNTFTLEIEDNDVAPTDDLQIDLTWQMDDEDVDDYNLDFFIAYNVVIEDDMVEEYEIYDISENTSGFETLTIPSDAPDQEYYLVVAYVSGSKAVDYALHLNGAGFEEQAVEGEFAASDVGLAMFYGPLNKDGDTFGRYSIGHYRLK
jgi:hypothetical protein